MENEDVEVDIRTIEQWPDGSFIKQARYRNSDMAPWIIGLHEVFCGECRGHLEEAVREDVARIALLEHVLGHVKEELAAMRAAFHKIDRRAT